MKFNKQKDDVMKMMQAKYGKQIQGGIRPLPTYLNLQLQV